MRKAINLFTTRKARTTSVLLTEKAKLVATGLGIVLFGMFMVTMFLQLGERQQISTLQERKRSLLQELLTDKTTEAKQSYFSMKKDQLKLFLKDDAQFLPYYTLLKDILAFSSESPILDTMTLDKNKSTEFVVRFAQYEPAYEFLRFVESDSFLKNFSDLKLQSFSLSPDTNYTEGGYQLKFTGKFKPLNGKTIQK